MMVRTAEDIGLFIRERRRELGLDQQALAKKVGVSRLWIIEFERGKPRAEIGLVMRTARPQAGARRLARDGSSASTAWGGARCDA